MGSGEQSGFTTLALQSQGVNGSGLGTTDLGSQSVTIHATGYQLAATDFSTNSVDLGTIHAGGVFTPQFLGIGNTLAAGTYHESLVAQFANPVDVISIGGPVSVAAGAPVDTSLGVSLADNSPGLKSGMVNLQFSSQEVNDSGSGTTNLPALDKTVTVSGKVFNGTGVWTQSSGSSSSWGTSASWTDASGIHAAPGTFAGFDNVDTAVFNGTGTTSIISLNGTSPSIKALNLSGSHELPDCQERQRQRDHEERNRKLLKITVESPAIQSALRSFWREIFPPQWRTLATASPFPG